jgi:hypothetical protein
MTLREFVLARFAEDEAGWSVGRFASVTGNG